MFVEFSKLTTFLYVVSANITEHSSLQVFDQNGV